MLYNVAHTGTEVCVKGFGSPGERVSDPEERVRTSRVRESERSWRNHREVNWDLQDEKEFPQNRREEYLRDKSSKVRFYS